MGHFNQNTGSHSMANTFGYAVLALLPVALLANIYPELFTGIVITVPLNAFIPIYILLVSLCVAVKSIQVVPAAIWTPLFLFPLQSAVFFGFGPLVEVFGNQATLQFIERTSLSMTALEFTISNALSVLGVMLVFFGFWLHAIITNRTWSSLHKHVAYFPNFPLSPNMVAVSFTVAGFCLSYFLVKPAQWGMINLTVPGAFTSITPLVHVGFGLVAYLASAGSRKMQLFFWLLWPLHFVLIWLTLEKAEIILAILLPMIGAYTANRNLLKLMFSLAILMSVFYVAQSYVTNSRAIIYQETGNIDEASYVRRAEIALDYFGAKNAVVKDEEDVEFWWRRLNYSNVQSYAIRAYDAGQSMDTFKALWMRFVPRIIWADKPILYGLGREFYHKVSGNRGSSLGITIYGDAYWQYGWITVFLMMPIIGALFSYLSMLGLAIIQSKQFIYFPIILLSLKMGTLGPLGFITETIISPIPIMLAYYVVIVICVKLATSRRQISQRIRL